MLEMQRVKMGRLELLCAGAYDRGSRMDEPENGTIYG